MKVYSITLRLEIGIPEDEPDPLATAKAYASGIASELQEVHPAIQSAEVVSVATIVTTEAPIA